MGKNRKLDIVFAGTPEFSVPFLEALCQSENLTAVLTQPDRPAGRKRVLAPPPAKIFAEKNNIKILQPENINSRKSAEELKKLSPDLIAVVSYGKILKKPVLDIPALGCLNIHPSLLPKYRGPCPVEWTLINGDALTGVCCIMMEEGLDSGGIIEKKEVRISISDNRTTLEKKLIQTGTEVLLESIRKIKEGKARPCPQEGEPVYAPFIKKEDRLIDWKKSPDKIHNLIRALNPSPGARSFTSETGRGIIMWESSLPESSCPAGLPGEITGTGKEGTVVSCGDGNIIIKTVQPEGGKKQDISDFLRGRKVERFKSNLNSG